MSREEFEFRKKVKEAREKLNKRTAQILVKEYLIELFNKCSQNVDGLDFLNLKKFIKTYENDIKKFKIESEELLVLSKKKYDDGKEKKKTELPEDILQTSKQVNEKLKRFFEIDKEFQIKKCFLEELYNQIASIEKKLKICSDEKLKIVFFNVLENLRSQLEEAEKEFVEIKEIRDREDRESWKEVARIYDALDRFKKGLK